MKLWNVLGGLVAVLLVAGWSQKTASPTTSATTIPKAGNPRNTPGSLHLRLVNAKSGKPMGKQNLNISWDDSFSETTVFIPKTGFADVAIPVGVTSVHIMEGPRMGKEPGRVAFQNCNSVPALTGSINDVLAQGLKVENQWSQKVHRSARPGEVIFYGIPLPWWTPDFQ